MELVFVEETHQYLLGDKQLISVTQLLSKHGLAPDYSNVKADVLKKKADRGTLIHAEIEDYIKHGNIGFTDELAQFIDYIKKNDYTPLFSELMVHNDLIAGTIDLILEQNGKLIISDNKTTSKLHNESVRWQLSIYLYLYLTERDCLKDYSKFGSQVFHFGKDGLNVVDIDLMPLNEVEKLIECERKDVIYHYELAISDLVLDKIKCFENNLKSLDLQKKIIEANLEEYKKQLYDLMAANQVDKWTSFDGTITITRKKPCSQNKFDSTKFKEEHEDLYKQYLKTSEVRGSITIKIKESTDE